MSDAFCFHDHQRLLCQLGGLPRSRFQSWLTHVWLPLPAAWSLGREPAEGPLLAGCVSGNPTPQLLRGKAGRASSCNSRTRPPEGDGSAEEGLRLGTTSLLQSLSNALWTPRRVFSPPALFPDPYRLPLLHPPRCLLLPRLDSLLLALLPKRL